MFPIEMTTVWFLMFDAVCFYFGMVDFWLCSIIIEAVTEVIAHAHTS